MAQKQLVRIFAVKAVEVSVWLKPNNDRHNASFEISVARCYRGSDGWHRSSRFYPDDLPRLRTALDEAYRYVALRTIEPRQAPRGSPAHGSSAAGTRQQERIPR